MATYKLNADMQIHTVPKLDTTAYLLAKAKYNGEAPLLSGDMNIFRDGAFVGTGSMPVLRPAETSEIWFGSDDKVVVTHRVLGVEGSDKGLITKERKLANRYVMTVENLHKKPVNISIFDQIPVAKDGDIDVEIDKNVTTQGYFEDDKNRKGVLSWTSDFKPREKKQIDFGYAVSYPKNREIRGM